ncbi:alpha-glucan family phosphorylase [Candidatus Giovannonibacteria bacterium]|nr:alpha-glucan family phosphorylase [Candidatus Giovannonibacteria bacterium]
MGNNGNGVVAYFSPEFGIDQQLPIYSGGLGLLAASLAKSFREMNIPVVVVSVLAREGYYDQYVEEFTNDKGETDFKMGIRYKRWEREEEFLEDTGVIVPININDRLNVIKVWKLKDLFGSVPVYLLDTDVPPNDHIARLNTRNLYGGTMHSGVSWEDLERRRLAQYYILGKGGVKALRRLGIKMAKYHLNESHSYFAAQEILSGALKQGVSWTDAIHFTKSKVVFSTHTPASSGHGHQVFPLDEVAKMANINCKGPITVDHLRMLGGDSLGKFNMTAACFHLAGVANAVSKKHLEGIKKVWGFLEGAAPIINITNAVNHRHLQYEEFRNARTPKEKAEAKLKYKRMLIAKYAPAWNENVFTAGWGRRGQAYKRMKLLLHGDNYWWLSNLMKENRIQVLMGGKPHPDDRERIKDWEELYKLSKSKDFPNLVVVSGYELDMMKEWSAGVDTWLNTPRSSCEASGTSGMKGNGAINCSTPDGWMWEAEANNYFPFGLDSPIDLGTHDTHDAQELQRAVNDMMTIYYHDRDKWNQKILDSDREVETHFDSNDRALQYATALYGLSL